MVATSHMQPVNIWNVTSENEILILADLSLHGHMWLMATILDSMALETYPQIYFSF